jgi:hypothetical protein
VENFILQTYLLPERLGFEIRYKTFENDVRFVAAKNISILARKNSHLNHLETFKKKYPALNFYSASILFFAEKNKIIYTSDIGLKEDLYLFNDFNTNIFITEVTHLPASALLEDLLNISADKFYFTHYSDGDLVELSEILSSFLHHNNKKVIIAEDGLIVEI